MTEQKNMFCNLADLRNEDNVEQFFLTRLLNKLGYKDRNLHTKETITIKIIGKGSEKKEYRPDYLIYINKNPIIAIDAKHPEVKSDEGLRDALMYSREINGEYTGKNPIKYCIGSNGIKTKVCRWDENKPILELDFEDFQTKNEKYLQLKTQISYNSLKKPKNEERKLDFEYKKPDIREIKGIFKKCHKLIWKKERIGPTKSFYEFSKIMFIKLNEDKKIKELLEDKGELTKNDFFFSSHWIEQQSKVISNPINSIMFKNLKDELEEKIKKKEKKRIFEKIEEIDLKPSTIKEVVKLLEHYDLISIDEDLNGRLFETFLSATIRGKELGQFFTPRLVVKFMTNLAELNVDFKKKETDIILDGCCGTGGFLIETMADLSNKINNNKSLTDKQKETLIKKVRFESIYGIDDSPMISKIARINMHLHGDGGSRIYRLDFLDKNVNIETDLNKELAEECQEYKEFILNDKNPLRFDVIITNPPFSMRYEKKDPNECKILEEYYFAFSPETNNMYASLQSNVMFIERYYELLEPHGKLITVIDESLLTTPSHKQFRDFIKEKFIIKAVISLPENTFVKADTGVKTSILYLIKKENDGEQQPSVFMALCENVGHNDAGRSKPELNELFFSDEDYNYDYSKGILGDFLKFEQGIFHNKKFDVKNNKLPDEKDWKTFMADSLSNDRIDVKYNSPYLKYLQESLKRNDWDYLGNLINIEDTESPLITDYYRLIDLRDIEEKTAKVLKIKEVEELNSDKILFKKGQLLISTLSPGKGKIIFIDDKLAGCVGSTEFVPVSLKSGKITMNYLWVILRTKIVLDQWKYQVTGSTPSRYRISENEVNNTIIPIPDDKNIQSMYSEKVIKAIKENEQTNKDFANELLHTEEENIRKILKIK